MVATAAPLWLSPRVSPFNVFDTSGWVLFGTSFSAPLDWSAGWRLLVLAQIDPLDWNLLPDQLLRTGLHPPRCTTGGVTQWG